MFEKYRSLRSVLPISDQAIQIWVNHLQDDIQYSGADGTMRSVGLEEKLVLATAIAGFQDVPISLVAKREVAHTQLHVLGLKIEDPYDERTAPRS